VIILILTINEVYFEVDVKENLFLEEVFWQTSETNGASRIDLKARLLTIDSRHLFTAFRCCTKEGG